MKAPRRSAGLPSLSISIPPSPTSTQGAEDDDPTPTDNQELVAEPQKDSGERTKTVTFSGPQEDEEGDLSDAASSICHSPSWEGFGQSSKKKAKKREKKEKKKLEEKAIKASKKQANRLSKAPPQNTQNIQTLNASDRSLSAPNLEQLAKFNPRSLLSRSITEFPTETMASQIPTPPAVPSDENIKPKSRGFLASFRSSSAGPKKASTPRGSVDESQSIHSGTFAGPPSHLYNSTVPGADHDFTNPRQAPSIRSNASGSTQSMSSQEKRSGLGRHSSNSGHGRSMSLLARLKGPSYLYYHGSDSEAKEDKPRPPLSRSALSSMDGMPAPQHNPRPASALALLQKMDGATDNGEMRGRQHSAHPSRLRDPSSDYEEADLSDRRERRQHTTGYTSAPQQPIANEGRRRPQNHGTHGKSRNGEVETHPAANQDAGGQKQQAREQHNAEVKRVGQRPIREPEAQVQHTEQVEERPDYQSNAESCASPYRDEVDRLSARHRLQNREDRSFVRDHAPSAKPTPNTLEPQSDEQEMKKSSPSPSVIGRAVSYDADFAGATESSEDAATIEEVVRLEEHPMIPMTHQRPSKVEKPADYFAFISESYAPPSLELRSPTGDRMQSSPRIEEASDEEDEEEPSWSIMTPSLDSTVDTSTQAATSTSRDPTMVQLSSLGGPPVVISPAMSADQSDSDVPAFEHLGDVAQATRKVETHYQPRSLQEEQSSGNSERSSSSTNGEFRPLTSAITTPNSSRPHSRKGHSVDIVSRSTVKSAIVEADERATLKAFRASIVEPPTPTGGSRPSNPGTYVQDDSWSRTALPIDHDDQSVVSSRSNRVEPLVSTPSLAASPTSVAFADELKEGTEEPIRMPENPRRQTLPPKAHSAIDLPATSFLPPLRHQPFNARKAKTRGSSTSLPTSLPNSPPPELDTESPALRPTSLKSSRNNSSTSQDSQQSPASASAAYLQEARKTVPVHPLSSRALRPVYPPKGTMPPAARSSSPDRRGEPVAKMLVECCNCKFFHDMPSRVYECMAKPESVVEDKLLGVSATITTMVKCPWCAHGMTTQCCAGYAAVIYLKEKLHGK